MSTSETSREDQVILDYFAAFQNSNTDDESGVSPLSPLSPSTSAMLMGASSATQLPGDYERYPHCPLYLPSRGRGDQERGTITLLVRDLIPFTVVVEPGEETLYQELIDRVVFTYYGADLTTMAPPPDPPGASKKEDTEDSHGDRKSDTRALAKGEVKKEEDGEVGAAGQRREGPEHALSNGREEEQLCVCCVSPSGSAEQLKKRLQQLSKNGSSNSEERQRLLMRQLWERKKTMSPFYHHGYVFAPFLDTPADPAACSREGRHQHGACEKKETEDEKKTEEAHRIASQEFYLHTVEQVRSLFRVAVLPLGGQGVSYVRNYILQVLVPSDMVAAKVDRMGSVDELELFGPSEPHRGRPSFSSSPSHPSGAAVGSQGAGATPNTPAAASTASKAYLSDEQLRSILGPLASTMPTSTSTTTTTTAMPSPLRADNAEVASLIAPHALYGYYWVMDDDIYSFFHAKVEDDPTSNHKSKNSNREGDVAATTGTHADANSLPSPQQQQQQRKNVRISAREMMRQMAIRLEALKEAYLLHKQSKRSGGSGNSGGGGSHSEASMYQRQQALLTALAPQQQTQRSWSSIGGAPFTCKEDCIRNNLQSVKRPGNGGSTASTTTLNLSNFVYFPLTACLSLEYSRFAYTYDDSALAVNSYNNIACLFNYHLLHTPMETSYFPHNVPGVRAASEVLGCGLAFSPISLNQPYDDNDGDESDLDGNANEKKNENEEGKEGLQQLHQAGGGLLNDSIVAKLTNRGSSSSMLWYRFTVREDYDFTLQLIARGMCTVRFRNLSFDVPQMAKLRGGMTDYYKHRSEEIRWQNETFVRQWPSVAIPWVKGKNGTERDDIKVRWDLLHPARARYPGAFLFLAQPLPQIQQQQQQQQQQSPRTIAEQASTYAPSGSGAHAYNSSNSNIGEGSHSPPFPSARAQPLAEKGFVPLTNDGALRRHINNSSSSNDPFPSVPRGPSLKTIIQQQQKQPPPLTAAATTTSGGVTWKGKRHWGSDVEDDSFSSSTSYKSGSSSSSSSRSGDKQVQRKPTADREERGRKAPRVDAPRGLPSPAAPLPEVAATVHRSDGHYNSSPKPQQPPQQQQQQSQQVSGKHGWKGYAVERWRDLQPAVAAAFGLHPLPSSALRAGATIAVVPPSFANTPSCVLATLIERVQGPSSGEVTWMAVAQRARGIPILSIAPQNAYAPPEKGVGAVAAEIDRYFSNDRQQQQQQQQQQGGSFVAAEQSSSSQRMAAPQQQQPSSRSGGPYVPSASWLDG